MSADGHPDMTPLKPPGTQWPEDRGFSRLYEGDPHTQARLVHHLLGFRALLETRRADELLEALDCVIAGFSNFFPEFLTTTPAEQQSSDFFRENYEPDERMLTILHDLFESDL